MMAYSNGFTLNTAVGCSRSCSSRRDKRRGGEVLLLGILLYLVELVREQQLMMLACKMKQIYHRFDSFGPDASKGGGEKEVMARASEKKNPLELGC
jgi:hypothetical protein